MSLSDFLFCFAFPFKLLSFFLWCRFISCRKDVMFLYFVFSFSAAYRLPGLHRIRVPPIWQVPAAAAMEETILCRDGARLSLVAGRSSRESVRGQIVHCDRWLVIAVFSLSLALGARHESSLSVARQYTHSTFTATAFFPTSQTDRQCTFLQCLVYLARQCSGARLEVREQYRSAAVHQAISGRFSRATAAAVVEEERIRMRRG